MLVQVLISLWLLAIQPDPGRSDLPFAKSGMDSLTVYIFLHDECKISQYFTPELTRLYDSYVSQKVGFVGYFPNPSTSQERIEDFGKDYRLSFPLLEDYEKEYTKQFGITITPEVAVFDHRQDKLIYRGRIDDSYVRVGKRKTHVQKHDLEEIITGWVANMAPRELVEMPAVGCFINFTN